MQQVLHTIYLLVRRYRLVAAYAVLAASIGVLITEAMQFYTLTEPIRVPEQNEAIGNIGDSFAVDTLPSAQPIELSIPKLGIETTFEEPLGLKADRTIEVPLSYEQVGWYRYSPTPGELGPSVILGHVDSKEGPAVFFSLGQLQPGDRIEITREDGSVATFEVTALVRYEQEGFPNELVYGDIEYAGLRLVTCSGVYDREEKRYSHNLVVYAALITQESIEGVGE